jgi:CheY-like chemotaxis protein
MAHKILVIDDDKINISLVKFTLTERRYHVIFASDGDEGLALVKSENPDLIILDIQMPRMNGYEFMAELRQLQGFDMTPVVMLTANQTLEDVFRLEGVRGYFVKPVDLHALVKKIVDCLGANPV